MPPTPPTWTEPVDPPADELPLRAGAPADEIQGDILAGFLKDNESFLLLRFNDPAEARSWLGRLIPQISRTREVARFNAQYSNARRAQPPVVTSAMQATWRNVSFTAAGLVKLSPNLDSNLGVRKFGAFFEGPVMRANKLRDQGPSDPSIWAFGGPGQQNHVDAVLILAADHLQDLRNEVVRQRALAQQHQVVVVSEQTGENLQGNRTGTEHFGFRDNISQPGVRGFHEPDPADPAVRLGRPGTLLIEPGEFVRGHRREDGGIWLRPRWMVNGSFQVLRRLKQDVRGWWDQVETQQASLPPSAGISVDKLAAKLVGRWRSGTPLALRPNADSPVIDGDPGVANDFGFAADPAGIRTPRSAHIRKMNPRDVPIGQVDSVRRHRIIRRGIPFGPAYDPQTGAGNPNADRGLLFNAYMASLEIQFEFLQKTWANEPNFPRSGDGPDSVIGNDPARFRLPLSSSQSRDLDFRRLVHTRGSLYCYVPSISTLRELATGVVDLSDDDG